MDKQLPLPPAEAGSIVGGPWMIDADLKSTVYMKNLVGNMSVQIESPSTMLCAVLVVFLIQISLVGTVNCQTVTYVAGTGAVTGHVYCGDTGKPARFATVTLQYEKGLVEQLSTPSTPGDPAISITTGLDGGFTITGIRAGKYLVLGWMPGYVSLLSQWTIDELDNTTNPYTVYKDLTGALRQITVETSQFSTIDITLQRGAEVSGRVSYDDGSPVVGAEMKVYRKKRNEGDWSEIVLRNSTVIWSFAETDDRGHFRLTGLPPGKYLMSAALPTQKFWGAGILNGDVRHAMDPSIIGKITVYSGDALRQKDAKAISVAVGDNLTGEDLTIPLSKLFYVSGTVSAKGSGTPVTSGTVEVLYADDGSLLQRTHIESDGSFRLNFIPSGSFIMKVTAITEPADAKQPQADKQSDVEGRSQTKAVSWDVPLSVRGDISGLSVEAP